MAAWTGSPLLFCASSIVLMCHTVNGAAAGALLLKILVWIDSSSPGSTVELS